MTAERTRGKRHASGMGPSFTRLTCDFRQPNGDGCPLSTPMTGDSATALRRVARDLGWVRVDGKDYCPAHTSVGA